MIPALNIATRRSSKPDVVCSNQTGRTTEISTTYSRQSRLKWDNGRTGCKADAERAVLA